MTKARLRTCLWFDQEGEEVANFYTSLLPDSYIETTSRPNTDGPALVIEFTLAGAPYMILNGGPHFQHSPAASISVLTENQTETDRLWAALTEYGGEEGQCGWLTDKFGVSWQIVPTAMLALLNAEDKDAAQRAQAAMMEMKKIDISTLEAAFRGD